MKRRRAILKYDDAPPSVSGLEVAVYLADEVDEVLKRQAQAALSGMDSAKAVSSAQMLAAHRMRSESSPDALESERSANSLLTCENEQFRKSLSARLQQVEELRNDLTACQLGRDALRTALRGTDCTHFSGPVGDKDNGTVGYCIDGKHCTCDLAAVLKSPAPQGCNHGD